MPHSEVCMESLTASIEHMDEAAVKLVVSI